MNVLLAGLSIDRVELPLARGLKDAGVNLFVIATPGTTAVTLCREAQIPFVEYNYRHRFDREGVALYHRLLDEHAFDIFHCLTNRSLSTALLATRKMTRPPKIVAYRGTMGHLSWFDPASHYSYLNKRVDCISCVSDAVRRYLKEFRIPDERLEVIWKGHDPSWYQAASREAITALGIPADADVVNFTGNIRPVKGVEYLLKAFAAINPAENIHLLVVGEVRDRGMQKWRGRYPHIHFAGYRKDATALAGACDIAIMPSIEREGLPKAVLEAMAQGVAPIVTAVGGMTELVEEGVSGLVIPAKDAAAIANAVRRLAGDADLRRSVGAAARARIEGPFNFRHTVEKTLRMYERLVRNGAHKK